MSQVYDSDEDIEYHKEDIDKLCLKKEEEDIDIQELLDIVQEPEKITLEEDNLEDIIFDINLGEEIKKKYKLALETNTPENFIFMDENGEYFSLFLALRNKEDMVELFGYYNQRYKISTDGFIFSYFLANVEIMKKEDIIDNLNELEKISSFEINNDNFERIANSYRLRLEALLLETREKYKKLENFYDKLSKLEYSTSPEKMSKSIYLSETRIAINIRDGEFVFSPESGSIVFNNMISSYTFPYIRYHGMEEKYFKVFEGNVDLEEIIKADKYVEKLIEDNELKKENYIFVLMRLNLLPKEKYIILEFDLERGVLTFNYMGNSLEIIKKNIKYLLDDIIFQEEKVIRVLGNFELIFNNYDSTRMYFLTLFDDIISKFLYVKEESRPRSLSSDRDKYYFKTYSEKKGISDYSISFFIEPLYANRYNVQFRSKVVNNSSINEFALILSKLAWYYNHIDNEELETYYNVVVKPYTGKDGEGLGAPLEEKKEIVSTYKSKKIDNLLSKAPEMFPKNEYARACGCPKQPVIIDKEDRIFWENYKDLDGKSHEVLTFPPEKYPQKGKKFDFVCPTANNVLSFIPNPDITSEYPILPCCTSQKKSNLYENYEEIKKNPVEFFTKKEEGKSKYTQRKTISVLNPEQNGILPEEINLFLNKIYPDNKFSRVGVLKNSPSSLIHCLIRASGHIEKLRCDNDKTNNILEAMSKFRQVYMKKNIGKREKVVEIMRKNMYKYVSMASASQENFNFNERQIINRVENINEFFDSKYYYKLLENIFFANIFVFVYKDGEVILEDPSHRFFHLREINLKLPTVLLFRYKAKYGFDTYELIKADNTIQGSSFPFLFPDNLTMYMKNYIEEKSYYVCKYDEDKKYQVYKNYYSNLDWNQILKDYEIINQGINDSGRAYRLTIKLDNNEKITLYIPPSFPLNVPESNEVFKAYLEDIEKYFADDYIDGSDGVWFRVNDEEKGVFIPCHDVSEKKNNICLPYYLEKENNFIDDEFYQITVINRNANIIKQLIIWCWNLTDIEEAEKWFDIYVVETEEKDNFAIFSNMPITIEYRFPLNIKTIEEAIDYLSSFIPLIFRNNKIYLYHDLYENLLRYVINYQKATKGLTRKPNNAIINSFTNEKDFTSRPYTKIILGEENWNEWRSFVDVMDSSAMEIEEVDNTKIKSFLYKNKTGHIYLVQNNDLNSLEVALLISKAWNDIKINLGYYINLYNIWSCLENNVKLFELDGLSKKDIIAKANQYSSKKINNYCDAVNYLERNDINYNISVTDYYLYKKDGSVEKRGECKNSFSEIWQYDNGNYASLLRII